MGYWVAPPVALASHARIEDALSRVIGGPQSGPQICFTGWTDAEKDELKARAVDSGFRVMTNVSVHLNFLCAGQSPGHVKIANAIDVGAAIISGSQFESLCEARTGKTEIQ